MGIEYKWRICIQIKIYIYRAELSSDSPDWGLKILQNNSLSEDLVLSRTNEFNSYFNVAHSSDYLTESWYCHSDLQNIMKVKTTDGCELLLKLNVTYYLKVFTETRDKSLHRKQSWLIQKLPDPLWKQSVPPMTYSLLVYLVHFAFWKLLIF